MKAEDEDQDGDSSPPTSDDQNTSASQGDPESPTYETVSKSRSPPPLTILRKGNSDPFSALPIPVDARDNSLIAFYRDFELPTLYFLDTKSWVTSAACMKDWSLCTNGLQDPCFAYAFLARNATVASMVSPSSTLTKQALVYRTRSTALLRSKIADKQQLVTSQTLWAIHGLFGAEVLARNLAAAAVHGKMLRYLFEKWSETNKVDLEVLGRALYNDIQLAAMFLTRPSFDLDKWIPEIYAPSWNAAAQALPSLSAASTTFLDPSIDSDGLRSLFIMRREATIVWWQSSLNRETPRASPLVMNWLLSRNLISQGRLINHYLDTTERYNDSGGLQLDHLCTQAYLSLAALLWTRAGSTNPVVCGAPLFDAEPNILRYLRSALARSEITLNPSQLAKYANARLWALYVGAGVEQAQAKAGVDPSKGWFNSRLAKQAKLMGLLSWQQVRQVLEGFLYSDHLRPHGSQWFWKTMGANLEGRC